ncbi:MAG: SWIM zinc finger family protein [Methanospirillum sp.]|uniref:SWIM zinc finger family protein n=1 Tax=Methanospirillum sp. TaxID=45200 RepID=UPI002373BD0E|nr:SWIM zinc finger family protein [Methanospirillum sp.]MDD1728198.1 SWIM zinc finger family protein [Methanospirillum sp.]
MGYYPYYEKTSPRPVKDGIKAKSRKGAIGEQWWSQKFLDALHAMGMENRLARGRTYARKGQVISLQMEDGVIHAKVQGSSSRPYTVTIEIPEWNEDQWERVFEGISSQALYSAQMLSGEMPPDIDSVIQHAGLTLFPAKGKDLKTYCSCPDYANPCKHIAAVYYILAERFDTDPFLIFAMRGRTKDQILEAITARRGAEELESAGPSVLVSDQGEVRPPEELTISGFYSFRTPVTDFMVRPGAEPAMKGLMVKRLSDSPFVVGKKNFSELIAPVYEAAPAYVRDMIHGNGHLLKKQE